MEHVFDNEKEEILERKHVAVMLQYDAKIERAKASVLRYKMKKEKWARRLFAAEESLRKDPLTWRLYDEMSLAVAKSRFKMCIHESHKQDRQARLQLLEADRDLYKINTRKEIFS